MMGIKEIIEEYKSAEKNKIFPFSEWHRRDVFERLIKPFLITIGYNPDQINYDDTKGTIELEISKDLKAVVYVSSIQEEQRFLSNKISAPIDTIPDPSINKPKYEIAVVTNFEKWFFYFDGKEIYAIGGERIEEEFDTLKSLISRDAIESGKFKEVARKLLYKEDNEPLRQELNTLRLKIANKILQEKTNIPYLKKSDGSYNTEILNEITTRWITRFLSLKLAEDSGINFNFTLRDIRRSFELSGRIAKPVQGAKVKEETLSNAIRALMHEFERRFNGGIFMYEEGVEYITVPDSAFIDLLDFTTGWAFTIEDARIIGFVYERFLGQEIVVEEKKGKPEAVLKNIGEARGRRKAGGIYYTPKYIVDYIVENTLGEILKEKRNEIDKAVKNLEVDKFIEILREVKSLRVLDPACGSGSFLIKVLAEFKNFYEEVKNKAEELKKKIDALKRERTKGQMLFTDDKEVNELLKKYKEIEKEIEELKFPGVFALRNNIYGVDLDPKAIDITAFTLMVQVYDELKEGARCPTMINENLKFGNSLVSAITPEERNGFISRKELERFKDEVNYLIKLMEAEKSIDTLDDYGLGKLIEENFEEVIEVYLHINKKYPKAILIWKDHLDEWYKKAKKEPIEKTFYVLINQTGLARKFLKEVYFEKIKSIKEKIEDEINKPLIRYFNSEKRVLKDEELEEILLNDERTKEELRFVKDRATEISKSQPPKVFNWEIEFPEVFFNEDGRLKENPGFDCVVGNPPYLALKNEDIENYKLIYGLEQQIDIYHIFIIRFSNSSLVAPNGYFSMIVPDSLLIRDNATKSREKLIKDLKSLNWTHIKRVFKDSIVASVIPIARNLSQRPNKINFVRINKELKDAQISLNERNYETYTIPYHLCTSIPNFRLVYLLNEQLMSKFFKYPYTTCEPKNENIKLLEELCSEIFRGEEIGKETIREFNKKQGIPIILGGEQIEKFWVEKSFWLISLSKVKKSRQKYANSKILIPKSRAEIVAGFNPYDQVFPQSVYGVVEDYKIDFRILLAQLNSSISNFIMRTLFSDYKLIQPQIELDYIRKIPIRIPTPDQQAPIISLVDAIIQKKKEYHAISQNVEDYVDFKKTELIRLDDFFQRAVENFDVLSSIKVKNDNFDALRVITEGDEIILEYGIKRKIEEYEEIDEEEAEVKGKYVIDWNSAGEGKIKDIEAIEFLSKVLEGIRNFSQAKQKSIWQKIAEVKVPEFNEKVKEGFLKFKSAMKKAKELDEETLRIDRAIDRIVYDLYGLTEDEIKVVEKSVWGDRFEEMYSRLPLKESALKLSGVRNG